MANRDEEIYWANKLQEALGPEYEIRYDEHDSAMTWCYHNNELYKRVPNEEMNGSINVADYRDCPNW